MIAKCATPGSSSATAGRRPTAPLRRCDAWTDASHVRLRIALILTDPTAASSPRPTTTSPTSICENGIDHGDRPRSAVASLSGRPHDRRLRAVRHARRHRRPHAPRHAVRRHDSADDFETGTIAAAFGGTTSLVDFAIQYRGQTMRHALDDWMERAAGKAVIDYAFHMIVTELPDAGLGDMDTMVRDEGITSFKLFMAYPGVFMVDDATIFRALRQTGENGGLVCMHAENGGVIDVLVKEALRKGQKAPKYHALTRPPRAEGEATGRAIALAEMAGVPDLHRPPVVRGRAREGAAGARHGPAGLRRDLPAVSVPLVRQLRGAGLRRRQVRDVAAAAREVAPGRALEGAREERPAGDLDRPLPVLHERAEGARARTTSARSRTARPASRPA